MRIYKRGNVYWYELEFNGQRIQRSTKSKNQKVAQQVASAYHVALIKGEVGIIDRKPSPAFKVAMESFLTWSDQEHLAHPETAARYRCSSLPLVRFFKDTPLDKISADNVEQYKAKRSTEKAPQSGKRLRPATVNREMACLRKMFNHLAKAHPDLRNPVSQVKFLDEDNQQTRVLTWTEQKKYLTSASLTLFDVVTLILESGMRPGEVFDLKPSAIDMDAGHIRVLKSKTPAGKRRIEMTSTARAIIERRMADWQQGYLFPCDRDVNRPLPGLQSAHERALKASGLEPFRLYDLRHTWATRAAESGIDLVTLAAMMGHSRIQMVLRYAHPTQNHQATSMARLVEHNRIQAEKEAEQVKAAEQKAAKKRLQIVSRTA